MTIKTSAFIKIVPLYTLLQNGHHFFLFQFIDLVTSFNENFVLNFKLMDEAIGANLNKNKILLK